MKQIILGTALLISCFGIKAQDPHFSQYFSSPLTLNPAMAGYFKNDYRFSANFRQQWWSVGAPFSTGTASFDTKLAQTKVKEGDIFAAGIMGLYDQSLSGGFKSVNAGISIAYHKALDEGAINKLAAGFQFTYCSRTINFNKLDFANQFNGSGFDTHIPNFETFGVYQNNYIDINSGLLFTHQDEAVEFYAGGSVYHLGRPDVSFQKNEKYRLPMRYTIHAGSRFTLGNGGELFLSGLYMRQAEATEKTMGIAYGHALNDETKIYAGSWYRIDDAILPYIGVSYNGFDFGISYDVINSSMKNFSSKNGSVELSLNITGKRPINYYTNYKGGRIF